MKGIRSIKKIGGRTYRKYDWVTLKKEFLKGPYLTVEEFKKAQGMPLHQQSKHVNQKTKGWMDEKKVLNQRALSRASEQILEEKIIDEKKEKIDSYNVGKYLVSRGVLALKDLFPTNTEEARKLISTGQDMINSVVGIGENPKGGAPHLTQVNVNFPKTKFDEMLNGLEYPELLKLIAEVKRERDRRIVPASDGQSKSET